MAERPDRDIEALACVEEIAKVDGVDHLFVGPADLSVALGVPGEYLHGKCKEALTRVSQAVKEAGKTWGILARGPEHAKYCRSLGCKLFAFGNDLGVASKASKPYERTTTSFCLTAWAKQESWLVCLVF